MDWCDSTWNPVTGCLHGCEYCYARKIAERFGSTGTEINTENGYECDLYEGTGENHVLEKPAMREWKSGKITKAPYPFCFDPTFHRYKLDEPKHWKKTRTIFVCSMADLFGEWVPDEWIEQVFKACKAAPQHRYLFLTKNPKRYAELRAKGIQPPANSLIGTSATTGAEAIARTRDLSECWNVWAEWFVSVEPIHGRMSGEALVDLSAMDWVIIGAETGNHRDKIVPEKAWVDEIVDACTKKETPVFMKESLREIMGDDFRQEFPWEVIQ